MLKVVDIQHPTWKCSSDMPPYIQQWSPSVTSPEYIFSATSYFTRYYNKIPISCLMLNTNPGLFIVCHPLLIYSYMVLLHAQSGRHASPNL